MKVCPKCGKLLSYNSYFGAYICEGCNWEDASKGRKRDACCMRRAVVTKLWKDTLKPGKAFVAR